MQYAYTPYGRSLGSTNPAGTNAIKNAYLFGGSQGVMCEEEGVPGLYFMRARYYSADAGVFLSTDPVQNIGPTWQPIAYAYANSNPLKYNDPKGEFWNFIIGAIVGFVSDVIVQTVIEGKSFRDINWARAGISAAMGAITGGVGGLTSGVGTSAALSVGEKALQVGLRVGVYALNMGVGAGTTVLGKAAENAASGQGFNLKGLSGADVLVGGLMGGVGLGGAKGGAKQAGGSVGKLASQGKKLLGRADDWSKMSRSQVLRQAAKPVSPVREALKSTAQWVGGEAALWSAEQGLSWGFSQIPALGQPWDSD